MITAKRVSLRAVEMQDCSYYHQWINDPLTNVWRGLYHPTSLTAAEIEIKSLMQQDTAKLVFTVLNEVGHPIGFVGLRGICSRSRRAEIWIYIGDRLFWNKGYGQEILSCLVAYSFEEMNLHRIWLECDPEFIQAYKCYEKVGFQKEGVLKDGYYRRGKFRDTMIMGLVRKYSELL